MAIPQPRITSDTQRYHDEPVFAHPKLLAAHVAMAFYSPAVPMEIPFKNPGAPARGEILRPHQIGTERVTLRWVVPDGKGGMKPKYPEREEH